MQVLADTSVPAGKTAGVSVLPCLGASFAEVVWTQTGGPAAGMVVHRNPAVALETSAPGTVSMRADARYVDGRTATVTADIAVTAAPTGSYVTVRGDHAVRASTSTSVRAWPVLRGSDTLTSITWTQVSGPTVGLDTSTPQVLMFKAPAATADIVLKFRATMTTSAGQDTDEVTVLVEKGVELPSGYIFEQAGRVYPFRTAGTYAAVLQKCVYDLGLYYRADAQNNLCTASTLPLLQAEAGAGAIPTVAQVMNRVLVSHDALGANFEQFLLTQDPHGDFRRMFAGVTAIVISSDVRPSFYTSTTGAIYLDAANLWLTPEQRDIVTEVPDYRSAFDDALNFNSVGRLVKSNVPARGSFPATERNTRPVEELVLWLGRLLYHELAHASDFFDPTQRVLNQNLSIWQNVSPRFTATSLPSDALAKQYPLQSAEMFGLAQVMFLGATPNATQIAYTATDVGNFFSADRASDEYAYTRSANNNSREDLAMLFEEFMMSYRHGVQYDMAFTNVVKDGMTAEQIIVGWGQRGRIGVATIKPRIKLVLGQITPWIDQAAVDALPTPIAMRPGTSWAANLVLGQPAGTQLSARMIETPAQKAERLKDEINKARH